MFKILKSDIEKLTSDFNKKLAEREKKKIELANLVDISAARDKIAFEDMKAA
jgi:hypothetical protein